MSQTESFLMIGSLEVFLFLPQERTTESHKCPDIYLKTWFSLYVFICAYLHTCEYACGSQRIPLGVIPKAQLTFFKVRWVRLAGQHLKVYACLCLPSRDIPEDTGIYQHTHIFMWVVNRIRSGSQACLGSTLLTDIVYWSINIIFFKLEIYFA